MALSNPFGKSCRSRLRFYCPRLELLEDRTVLSFITAPTLAAAPTPYAVAAGDFNGDGIPDLAVANYTYPNGTVNILLGKGDGTFLPAVSYFTGAVGPSAIVVGDFNGDGKPDLAVANSLSNTVSVLLNNGDGTFQFPINFGVLPIPFALAVGDFNGDGNLDLAVTNAGTYPNYTDGSLSILLGRGDGTFQIPRDYAVGIRPISVAVADFNHDGHLDVAVANAGSFNSGTDGSLSIFLGKGDGTLGAAQNYLTGSAPSSVAVADFNGDGILDLAVANHFYPSGTVAVLLGNGDGTFQTGARFSVGPYPSFVAVGDFNGDGHLDLAITSANLRTVDVLLNKGDGTFQAAQSYVVGSSPSSIAVGDFNGDGIADLAVANAGLSPVSVLLAKGDGTFRAARSYAIAFGPSAVALGDFNADGFPDLVVTNGGSNTVSVLLGNGDGTFQDARSYATGSAPSSVVVADFNGDGILDLAVANASYTDSTVSILLGNRDGTFQAPRSYATGIAPRSVAVADLNGDGILDLALADEGSDTVSVLLGNGDGSFQAAQSFAAGYRPSSVAVGDFNGDGIPDLAVANGGTYPANGTVSVLLGKGDGTFLAAQNVAVGDFPVSVAVADFNNDGHRDLVVAAFTSTVKVLLGNGDGTFQAPRSYPVGFSPSSVTVGDFNRDGIADVVAANFNSTTVSLLLGKGDGTFQAARDYLAGSRPTSVAVGDLNGDGFPDLAVTSYGTVSVLLNGADWGGGHAALPPGRPGLHAAIHRETQLEPFFAFVAASQSQKLLSVRLAVIDFQPSLVPHWPLPAQAQIGTAGNAEGASMPQPLFPARHAQKAVFERWPDPIADLIAGNWLK